MTAPISLVASMVLDSGGRWGEEATEDQWADMEALLNPEPPRRHYWLRARGRSKTFDAGAATLAMMLAGGIRPGDEMYAAASGRDQAGHLARKISLIAAATPELAGAVDIQNFKVITPRTGAVLEVSSSDLAQSWGKTPRWVFIDEIANHDITPVAQAFVNAYLTALPKRRDSVLLAATTPSSPNHWARALWDTALAEPDLWRCSLVSGPAPWQDPRELEGERRRLSPSLWRRLFLCEWAELDDQLATLEQVRACIGHDGILPPDPAHSYVHGVDLSYARDTTAVATCHREVRGRREILVLDRLRAWRPSKGRQVPLAEVSQYVTSCVREYGGMIHADPYQGMVLVQEWRDAGHQVKAAAFSPQENSRRASLLLSLIRERQLDLAAGEDDLFSEITSLRLAEGSTPGVLKLTTDGSASGHFDRSMALMLTAQELMTRPAGSWLAAYGTVACEDCGHVYRDHLAACPKCHPDVARTAAPKPVPQPPASPGGWAGAYHAVPCGNGHWYITTRHASCPKCAGGGAGPPRR